MKSGKIRKPRRPPVGGKWTDDEDAALSSIVERMGPKNWRLVRYSHHLVLYLLYRLIFMYCAFFSVCIIFRSHRHLARCAQMYSVCTGGTRCLR